MPTVEAVLSDFRVIEWMDNPYSVQDCIDFWEQFADERPEYDIEFVWHMVGWMHAMWIPADFLGYPVMDLFSKVPSPAFKDSEGKSFSKSETRRRIKQNNLTVNDKLVTEELVLSKDILINDCWAVLRSGKKIQGDYLILGVDAIGAE